MDGIALVAHRPGDRRFVREMLDLGVRETYSDLAALGRVTARERLDAIFEIHWDHPEKLILVALAGEEPVGVAWLEPSVHGVTELPEHMFLLLAVVPAWQRRGLGRWLMAEASDRARTAGARRIRLFVGAENAHARKLYAELGYRERTVEMQWTLDEPNAGPSGPP